MWLQTPGHSYRLEISSRFPDHYVLSERREDGGWQEVSRSERIAWRQVLELALPFKELHVEEGQTLQMTVIVRRDGLEIARYPRHQPAVVTVPDRNSKRRSGEYKQLRTFLGRPCLTYGATPL